MSDLNERVAALSPEKRALLERRLQAKGHDSAPAGIPRRPHDAERQPALSFAQQRLWFLEQLEPGLTFYNLPFATRLAGLLHVPTLERALNEIVRRHETLRTTFAMVEGRPAQIIADRLHVRLPVADLRELPEEEREAGAAHSAFMEGNRPFDLAQGPLFRARLLRLSDLDHVLLLTMHHIVSDGWSMGVLYRELAAIYAAYSAGRPSPLAELPIQYADFAVWQRELLTGNQLERLLSYWKNQLDGMPVLPEMPTDRPRPPVQAFQGASYSLPLSKALAEGLKAIGRQADATLFMTLLAVFKTLLFRYSDQSDVVVGSPIANRTRVELEGLIGFFVNTLVLRTDLSGDPTFRELLGRVKEVTLGAYAHQDMPFEKLVEELQPERNLSYNPLFQVMFVLQNTETEVQVDAQHNAPQFSVGTSKFDLTLCALETSEGLTAVFEYNTNLFDDSTILFMAQNFQALVESVLSQPERRISELSMLSRDERRRLTFDCNRTGDYKPGASLIQELCEAQAAERPEATAVTFGEQRLSYRELNERANRLAHTLREEGVGPETLVGLCVERSPEMIVGVLGILKAGAAYVPLDSSYPKDRLAYMLEDARAPLLLTQEHLVAALPAYEGRVVRLDADWPHIAAHPIHNPAPLTSTDNLAYVIYTSGSTGQPKGVMVSHGGVCNVAEAQARSFAVDASQCILQLASLSFDASVFEIVMALRSGATLCMASRDALLPGAPLLQMLRDERINVLTIAPSVLAVLPSAALPDLHTLIVAAESCPAELAARWANGRRFFNAYGPTEASIWATFAQCDDAGTAPPIGLPIAGTRAYVLDAHLEPVPVGVPGEIYLGGAGVTRGYQGRPDLTAEFYLPDPFGVELGARIYRTGDRARRLPGGEIQFLGRADGQLKLRGYRIEPAEVEASLLLHTAIAEAAVVAKQSASGDVRLVAYYVAPDGDVPDAATLRNFLRTRLPDYMIPSAFVPLDALPLNASGKRDRRTLSAMPVDAQEAAAADDAWAAPRTETEEALARIWCEVLEVERVGIHDSFFDLGGHSLLATRVVSRVNENFQIEIPLRRLFERPTIAAFAEAVEAAGSDEARPRRTAIMPVARRVVSLPVAPKSLE